MALVYCSYAIMDQEKPVWVNPLLERPEMKMVSVYDPVKSLEAHLSDAMFSSHMLANPKIDPTSFRMPPMLNSFEQSQEMLSIGDRGESAKALMWKDLFVLMRSDVIVADINVPSMGGRASELVYAYLWQIPIICVSHRFVNSPWMTSIADAIVQPNIDNLLDVIGHKLSIIKPEKPEPSKMKVPLPPWFDNAIATYGEDHVRKTLQAALDKTEPPNKSSR